MQSMSPLYCVVVLLFVYLESGFALKCYDCNSFTTKACGSIPPNSTDFLITCPAGVTGCRKVEQRLTYGGDAHIRYYRQCATTKSENDCKERSGTLGVKMFYCNCEGDGCNSSSTVPLSVMLLASAVAAIQLFKKL